MSTILHEFDFIIVNIKCVVIIMVSCFILNQNSTRMWLFVLLEECLMLKMLVENICVNPAFFLASDHNQKSVIVRKACKKRLFGTLWWSARHFPEIFHCVFGKNQMCRSIVYICTFGEDECRSQVTASVVNGRISDLVLVPINPPNPQHSAAVSSKQLEMISDGKKGGVTEKTPFGRGGGC